MTAPEDQVAHLTPGQTVRIVKLRPDGTEAATYNGTLVDNLPGWLVTRAVWEFRRMDLGYMLFEQGDYLLEYFSIQQPFNAFALFSPVDEFKGWYCNITHPTAVRDHTLYWHDLFVDVVQRADGQILVLDEDELAEAGLEASRPDLHEMILNARDTVVGKMRGGEYPFSEVDLAPH